MATHPEEVLPAVVERSIELDADLVDVWQVLTDPEQQGAWLGSAADLDLRPGGAGRVVDDDGAVREVLVTAVDDVAGEPLRLTWHWWHEDGPLSTVEITATPTSTGTLVRVVETLDPAAAGVLARRVTARAGGRPMVCTDADVTGAAWSGRLGRLGRMVAGAPLVAVRRG